jgi:PAS domain S-box-containing protein
MFGGVMTQPSVRRTPYQVIALFLALACSIGAVTWRYHVGQREAVERQVKNQLMTIADSKVKQVSEWLDQRMGEARSLLANRMTLSVIERLSDGRGTAAEAADVNEWLAANCRELQFANAIVTNREGSRIASAGRTFGDETHIRSVALEVIAEGRIRLRDLHNEPGVGTHLGLNIPLRMTPETPPFGALLLAIDPADYLDPVLNRWPVPTSSGEVLLVRREGDEALVLNELRLRPGSAMALTVPMNRTEVPAVRALEGFKGVMQGRNADGVAVFAATRPVPGTSWRLVAQMNAGEVLAPLWWRSTALGVLAFLLVVAAGGGVFILLRRQERQFDQAQYQSKADLQESEKRFRSVVENAPEGIVVISGLAYRYLNPAAVRMLGAASASEMIGKPAIEDVHPDERDSALPRMRMVEAGEAVPAQERRMLRGDGTVFQTEVLAVPFEHDGRPAAMAFYRDITERHRLEEQLRHSQKMESVGRLAGGVAHDFNNMLTVINGYSQMVLDAPELPPETRASIEEIRAAGERAAALTRQLLAFSRNQVSEERPLNLNHLVEQEAGMLRRLIGEDVDVSMRLDPALGLVLADRGLLQQMLMNLAVNARDAMPSGGSIVIETSNTRLEGSAAAEAHVDPGPYTLLTVSDTGTGMSTETLQRIFEPFYTTKPHGTGLGLATVYGIVRQSHGYIQVSSRPGEGSTFRIYLPHTDRIPGLDPEPVPGSRSEPGTHATVLVVEDQDNVRRLACGVLRRHGYRVIEAATGAEAVETCGREAKPIHLLLTDVVMPGMSGPELAAQLCESMPDLQVLLTTGYAPDKIASEIAGSPDHYLAKPFTPEELLNKVRARLAEGEPRKTVLVIDDDDSVRGVLVKTLRNAGYRVREARDGKAGMRLVRTSSIHLVITDLVMPEQEGLETVRMLRQNHPDLPVVAVSGAFDGEFLKAAGIFGAHSLLRKPIGKEDLLAVVRELAGQPS